jgi:hypothetical protein
METDEVPHLVRLPFPKPCNSLGDRRMGNPAHPTAMPTSLTSLRD